MPKFQELVNGKKVAVLGLGLLGRGAGDAEFLAQCGAHVLVTDKKTEQELHEPVARLKKYPNISFHLGGHRVEDFTSCDFVLKAAGVRLDSPEVAAARAAGVSVYMSTALFARSAAEAGVQIVGITGTRGKSTITHMVYDSLKRSQKSAVLGGNIRGLSTLALLPQVRKGDIAVLELDSWQLQGFGDLGISPHVALFANLMPDHQNYYSSMDEYFEDKAQIFRNQKRDDVLIVGKTIEARVRAAHPPVEPTVPGPIPADWMLQVPGEHNRENAALASAALFALGLNTEEIRDGLEHFEAVEGRLQRVDQKGNIVIYNDNNATTPEATIAALCALEKDISLIAGGSDKGLPLDELVQEIRARTHSVIVLCHDAYEGSKRLEALLKDAGVAYQEADSVEAALTLARTEAKGPILFSPAFASFGMFRNEYERNDEFMRAVRAL